MKALIQVLLCRPAASLRGLRDLALAGSNTGGAGTRGRAVGAGAGAEGAVLSLDHGAPQPDCQQEASHAQPGAG